MHVYMYTCVYCVYCVYIYIIYIMQYACVQCAQCANSIRTPLMLFAYSEHTIFYVTMMMLLLIVILYSTRHMCTACSTYFILAIFYPPLKSILGCVWLCLQAQEGNTYIYIFFTELAERVEYGNCVLGYHLSSSGNPKGICLVNKQRYDSTTAKFISQNEKVF